VCDIYDADALREVADLSAHDSDLAELLDLGIGFARPHRPRGHAFSWSIVQPPGTTGFDFSLADYVVQQAQQSHIQLLVTLYPYADSVPIAEAPPGLVPLLVDPDQIDGYQAFVEATVERYDGDGADDMPGLTLPVRHWEMGNEPGCASTDALCHQQFFDFVAMTWDAIKRADPEAIALPAGAPPIYLPGDDGLSANAVATYTYFFDQGGLAYADAFSIHLSIGSDTPDVAAYVSWWRAYTGDTPLWLGEFGARSLHDASVVSADPEEEARWLVDALDLAFASGVERVQWCRAGAELARAPVAFAAMKEYIAASQ
jgi:hypothetical protein